MLVPAKGASASGSTTRCNGFLRAGGAGSGTGRKCTSKRGKIKEKLINKCWQ